MGNQQETALELTPDAVRNFNETIKALHSFAQNPDTNRRRIIISGRQAGKTALREAVIPCPWEGGDGPEMFYPAATGHIKPSVDLKPRREVDRLRTADILQAMTMRNATDQAIPEEWMDELDDLVWRERDRLAADAGS
jgi:hypothetical protein